MTATLLGMPGAPLGVSGPYPRPPPEGPSAIVPVFWIVNVNPSAVQLPAGESWKLKSVVKVCTFTGDPNQALLASFTPPPVSRSRAPFRKAWPLSARPADEKPAA